VKSRGHFRAGFDEFFRDADPRSRRAGLTTQGLHNLPYRNIPRPMYPLDPEAEWQAPSPHEQRDSRRRRRLHVVRPARRPAREITVFTYRPRSFKPPSPVLIVMHGRNRNGADYRDWFVAEAERRGFLVAAPEFARRSTRIRTSTTTRR
jgi:hypothetical protein